jgi:tRNA threonylcarbamoyladenosine biosynthesis protein TsaB
MLERRNDSLKRTDMTAASNPTVLALDAAGAACSAALWRDGGVVARRWEAMARGHAEALMPMVEAVVDAPGYAGLDLICVGIGPGAYTGLRIAIATARGLALATGLPALGVGSFDVQQAMARQAGVTGNMAVVLETRRADVYFQAFDPSRDPLGTPEVLSFPDLETRIRTLAGPVTIVGDAIERFAETASDISPDWILRDSSHADAAVIAEFGATQLAIGGLPTEPLRPLYLRAPDTSPPAADRQRLR